MNDLPFKKIAILVFKSEKKGIFLRILILNENRISEKKYFLKTGIF